MKRIILLEFNELCPRLLDKWMASGQLPNFKRFHEQSQVFVTESDEPQAPYLEPWIQWYSMHTGMSFREHGVYHLSDGPNARFKDIWHLLLEHGKSVVNCSSMNAPSFSAPGSFFLPDPWCLSQSPFPEELSAFHGFISRRVREYTAEDRPQMGEAFSFLWFMATHGMSLRTVREIAGQLLLERRNPRASWRRAPLMDRLLSDVFRHYYRKLAPDFASFFLNSTAHYQHAYWRHMEPDAFGHRPDPADLDEYGNAVLFGYQQMDRLLADFFALEASGAMLVLATALSQQPYLKHEQEGGQHFYHPKDLAGLLRSLGLHWLDLNPVMAHQYLIRFDSEQEKERARRIMQAVTCNGEPVFGFEETLPCALFFGNAIMTAVPADALVQLPDGDGMRSARYGELFSAVQETKSGYHHPDGVLWFKTGTHRRHADKASILDVLPTLLSQLQVSAPADLAFKGRDLTRQFA